MMKLKQGRGEMLLPKQGENRRRKNMTILFTQLSALGTTEHFLSELKDVAFCMHIPINVLKIQLGLV
jgi:hypothetical protein